MSDLFDVFVFDLQRFAEKSATYGSIEGYSSKQEPDKYYWKENRDFYLYDEDGKIVNAEKATITFSLSSGKQTIDEVFKVMPASVATGIVFSDNTLESSAAGGSAIKFATKGNMYFGVSSATPTDVTFVDVDDKLFLNEKGIEYFGSGSHIYFKSEKYNFDKSLTGFDLQNVSSGSAALELTSTDGDFLLDSLQSGDQFTFISNLNVAFAGDNDVTGGNSAPEYFLDATVGGSVDFNLKKDLSVNVKEGGIALVATDTKGTGISGINVSINGMALDIDTTGFAYDNLSAQKPIIYFTDSSFSDPGYTTPELEKTIRKLSIGDNINASVKGMSDDYSGFILDKDQKAQGFIFASSDSAITLIFGDGEIPANFSIFADGYNNSEDDVAASIPQVSDSKIAAIKKTGTDDDVQLALIVDDGAVVTDANGTSMTVDGADASFVAIVFDPETGNIEGVMPAADPQGSAATDPADFNSGLTINVKTAESTYDSVNGLFFGGASTYGSASSFVAIGSGEYTYQKGSTIISLANSDDTVFALDNATKLQVVGGSGTVVDATDGDGDASNDATYSYNSAEGNAYFSLKPNAKDVTIILNTDPVTGEKNVLEGKVSDIEGYVFVDAGDALNINGSTSIAVMYENAAGSATAVKSTPNVSASSYTVEMTAPYSTPINGGASVANFAVNNFSESGTAVKFGSGSFVFGTTEDEFLFDSNGDAVGFNASDSVHMDKGAAGFLDGTKGGSFLINDEDVNIVAKVGEDGLLYDADDNGEQSLYGLSSGSEIKDAGGITKVYASEGEGEFVIGGTTYAFNAAGASAAERAYFNVDGADAKGFTFVVEDDALKVTSSMPEEFALTDADTETEINAPLAYEDDSKGTVLDEYVITKGASSMYKMSGFSTGNYVEIDTANSTASVTMADVSSSAAVVYDMNTQALAGFAELEDGNQIKVAGVSTPVDFNVDSAEDADDVVEIAGDNVSYTYTYGTSAALNDVYADVEIKKLGGASYVQTAAGESGIGSYEFAVSGQSFGVDAYNYASDSFTGLVDGVKFVIGSGSTVTAIAGIDAEELVDGSESSFKSVAQINGQAFGVSGADYIAVLGTSSENGVTGIYLEDGDNVVVSAAASASIVEAADIEQITFGSGSAFTIKGKDEHDYEGVTAADVQFNLKGLSVVGISGVGSQESVTGYFKGVAAVNGVSFAVTDADEIMIVGNDSGEGITKIASVGGGASIANVGGASQVVTDTEGIFTFADNGSPFTVSGDTSVVFQMNTDEDALVEGVTDFGGGISATVSGMLQGIDINNSGLAIDIEGDTDEVFDYMVDAKGNATLGGVGNENGDVVTITETAGASFVQTNAKGTFVFASGQSFYTDDENLTFKVVDGVVTEIYGLDKGNFVKGSFSTVVAVEGDTSLQSVQVEGDSSVTVYHGSLILEQISDLATIQTADGIVEAWTDALKEGDTLKVTDGDGHTYVVAASASDSNGVMFALEGTNPAHILGVSSLAQSATLGGDLGELTAVNGQSFGVKEVAVEGLGGDGQFSVVGAEGGIGAIVGLGGSVAITDAGSAILATTNDNADITFADGNEFYVRGFSAKPEVAFVMNDGNAVAILGVSSNEIVMGSGSAFESIESVNTQDFDVKGASALAVVGNEKSNGLTGIAIFGGSNVSVNAAASAIFVDAANVDQITFGESSTFQIDGESKAVSFIIDEQLNVGSVNNVNAQESVTGDFTDVAAVNGQSFVVVDPDKEIMVVGNDDVKGISKIAKVSDGAMIGNVGGADEVVTNTEGEFFFVGHNDGFSLEGDSSITFQMVEGAAASVAGITNFAVDGESLAVVEGNLNGLFINDKGTIEVEGDADKVLSYAAEQYEGETLYGLAVGGSAVTVNAAASATFIAATTDGKYTFAMDKDADPTTYTVASAGDSAVLFEVEGNQVVGILDMNKNTSVTGDFSNVTYVEGLSAAGEEIGSIQITGDSSVTVVYDAFEVHGLNDGASITAADNFGFAYTEGVEDGKTLTVTDIDGDQFVIAGDSDGVTYTLDLKGNIIGVSGLDAGAVLSGNLGELKSVNGKAFDVTETATIIGGDGVYSVVGANDGIAAIGGLGGSVAIKDAGGAFVAVTNDDALITFKDGGQFYVGGFSAKPEVGFVMDGSNAVAINGISSNEFVMGSGSAFEALEAVNKQDFDVKGASALVVVGNDANDGLTGIAVFGGSNVVVSAAASATDVLAADVDQITFGESSTFQIEGESSAVTYVSFEIDSSINVGSVSYVGANESVTGNFNDINTVNGTDFDVTDSNEIMVVGNESVTAVSKIDKVSDGAVIAKVGGASQVITDTDGTFTFTNSNQKFEVHDLDESATFDMNGNDVANVNLDFGVVISDNSNFANVSVNGALVNIKGDEGDMAIGVLDSDGIDLVANLGSASGVTVNSAGGASYIAADKEGNFTFTKDGRTFEVGGDSQVVFVLDENENVTAIGKADKGASITSDFSKAVAFAGFSVPGSRGGFGDVTATVQIANDKDVMVVHDAFEVRMLSDGASISSATTVYKAYTDGAKYAPLTVIDASGDEFTVYGDADGVMYSLNGSGEIIAVDGLDENATLGGNLSELKAINNQTFDITETAVDGLGGNGVYSVVGGASSNGISKVIGLGGLVFVNNAGGASELVTDDNIVLRGGNSFAKRIHISNDADKTVTFGVSGTNDIVSVNDFGGTSSAVAIIDANLDGINGLTINDKGAVSVVGDGNDKVIFKDDGTGNATLTGIDHTSGEGVTIYSTAYADKIKTSGDGLYNFYGKQEFIVIGEGEGGYSSADSLKNAVWYDVDNDSVTAISSLNGSIAGDFTNAISVNGEAVQVLGDSGVIVVGTGSVDSAATNVSAIEVVNSGATVVAWGSASHVGVVSDKGTLSNYQFIGADKQAQNFIANDTTDSLFSFTTDKNKVTGVADLDDGGIAFNPNQTNALDVNTADYPAQSLTFASTESLAAFNVADRYVVAAGGFNGSISGIIAPSATVYGVDGDTDININGKDIFVDDDDDQFNVVVHDGTPDYLYDVDGDATVIAESVSVRANSAGTDTNPTKDNFVIGGDSYIFDDSKDENDGFTFVTDSNGTMNKVASLEGALVINDGEWNGSINGDEFEVIDYPNNVNPPVTVNSGASGIESVGGLDHKDTVNGDLDAAQVHIPGYGDEGGHYGTTITINGKPYTVVRDPDGVDVTGDNADVITDLDNQASLIGAEGDVTVNGTELEPEDGDVIKGDRDDNSHARIVGDDELIRQATAINHYNHQGYDVDTEATTAAAFNIEDVVGLPTYTGATTPAYLDRDDTDAINAGSSAIDFNQPLIVSLWNFADGEFQKDEQVFDMSSYSYTKKVYMNGDGPQAVKFNNAGGNLAVVADDATGVKNISLGAGGDAVVMDEDYALQNAVYIYGGAGDDSVFVRHNANTYIDFSAGGEDILVTAGEANARVTIDGYNASTGAAIRVEEYLDVENEKAGSIAQGIENGIISFAEGTVIITSDEGRSEVSVGTNGYGGQIVNLMTHVTSGNDSLQAVGFTGSDGGVVDGSSFQSPLIMIGNSDNTKSAGSSLVGGLANDTFLAGADDTVEVGYGNDYVSLFNDSLRGGAYVDIGYGRATIDGMNNTLADSTGDVISVAIDPTDRTFSLVYNADTQTVELESSADGYYALLTDVDTLEGNYTTQYIYDSNADTLYSVAIGTVGSTIKVTEDEDLRPDVFFGYQTAIDFREYTGDAIIDLRGDMAESIIDEKIVIIDDDVNTLYAGIGDTALKGDLDDETFFAGKGNTWIYGDGGKNLLVGYEGADKEGQTVFYVLGNEDGAANTIAGFNYVTDNNYTDTKKVTADALEFDLDDNNITRIDISGNDLVIEITDKAGNDTESALLLDAINADGTGKDFIVSDNVAQVAEDTLVFDQFADYYYATGKNATVEVSGRIEDDVVLWLDEDETGKIFEGDIHVIDATNSDATAQLAGNDNDNVIFAGTGETSLWGGEGGNDILFGNAGGRDTFYYSFGNGDDTITNVKDGDVIALDVSLDQIDEIDMSDATAIRIIMNDGDVLTINDAGHDLNVMIDNGEDGTDTYSTREARSRQ